jgi:hypothetical protein
MSQAPEPLLELDELDAQTDEALATLDELAANREALERELAQLGSLPPRERQARIARLERQVKAHQARVDRLENGFVRREVRLGVVERRLAKIFPRSGPRPREHRAVPRRRSSTSTSLAGKDPPEDDPEADLTSPGRAGPVCVGAAA